MPRIILLDEATAGKIAAGEVVERPASVVKELVENSLDAGSTRVIIEIRGGGLEEIKVVDNGWGMDGADAVTAFQRHATSKIRSLDDLEEICSLGFRGEALPSIAAVSKTLLVTRPPEAVSGTRLEVQGGRIMSSGPAGCPPGTAITVSDLFYNTPARLKHMKSKSAEGGQVGEIVSRLALARPDVSFRLLVEGRTSLQTPGTGSLLDALAAVYGANAVREMLALENSEGEITVGGLIAPPAVSRSSKRQITVIINHRYVKNPVITAAVSEGYGTLIPQGRFPLALVTLTINPRLLDVNVHPAKMVVKIFEEHLLFNLVKRTVRAALGTDRIIPAMTAPPGEEKESGAPARPRQNYVSSLFAVRQSSSGHSGPYTPSPPFVPGAVLEDSGPPAKTEADPDSPAEPANEAEPAGRQEPRPPARPEESEELLDSVYPLGFLPPTYILAGSSRGLVIIDQHAAHERMLYEKFLARLSEGRVESQLLLVPELIQLSPREYQAAGDNPGLLAGLGIGAEDFGGGTLAVREIPAGMPPQAAAGLIRDLLEYLLEVGAPPDKEEIVKKMAASAACRAAVKSGQKTGLEEAWAVIRGLQAAKFPYACPHGRPTMINISDQELRGRFKRT